MSLQISKSVMLPLDAVTQKLAFIGRTGNGKSYAAMKLAELMLEKDAQVVAIDPVGNWHGLRLPGRGAGFQVPVFGGLHGDVPIESTGGELIANVIADRGISAVLDVSQMLSSEQARFATDFATRFFQRRKSAPAAVHLFLEECQEFVPQNAQPGEQRMLHAFERLVKLGRNFGIGVSLISQRPQEVNKKALNQTECLFAFQMTGPQERKTMVAWMSDKGMDTSIGDKLPGLAVGECLLWSPSWLRINEQIHVLPKRSADASSTPKVGAKVAPVQALTPIDLDTLRAAMAGTIERSKAEDPRELRRRIAELEKQLKAHPPAPVVEVPVLTSGEVAKLTSMTDAARTLLERMESIGAGLERALAELTQAMHRSEKRMIANGSPPPRTFFLNEQHELPAVKISRRGSRPEPALEGPPKETLRQKVARVNAGISKLSSGERRIVSALAQHGRTAKSKLAILTGYSAGGGGFNNNLSALRSMKLMEGSGELELTELGLRAAGPFDPLPVGAELVEHWKRSLPKAERCVLDVLREARGALSKEELARATGYEVGGGGFNNALSRLRTLGLIDGRKELRIHDALR